MGGFKFGLSGGTSTGSSTSSISTEGIERSGTVHDLPKSTEGYGFSWQFVGWETTLKTGGLSYNVPVLSYLVQNVKQPPSKPQNLEAKEVTTNSVTLEWESGFSTAAQYQVYRYMPNNTSGPKYSRARSISMCSNRSAQTEDPRIIPIRWRSLRCRTAICRKLRSNRRVRAFAPVPMLYLPFLQPRPEEQRALPIADRAERTADAGPI